jgi:galactokinase
MTGGGFGGCVLALVDETATARVETTVRKAFADKGLAPPAAFPASPGPGARRLA